MPQVTNTKVMREKEFSPVGTGTVINQVMQLSGAIKERAFLANKTEAARLERIQRMIYKEHRFANQLQDKIIQRTTKSLNERRALLQLLENDFKVDKFITMKQGFDPSTISDKDTARRYVVESRVFNSGFNMKAMKPEVHRRIRKLDPGNKYKKFKKHLLSDCKKQNVEINRSISNSAFIKMLDNAGHWQDFNFPPEHERWLEPIRPTKPCSRPRDAPCALTREKRNLLLRESEGQESSAGDAAEAEAESNGVKSEETVREKSVVLEKRVFRPKPDIASMTMRSLAPVYFQSHVSDLSLDSR